MKSTLARTLVFLALAPAIAQAHPGHAHDATFAAGALHPLTGMDHVLMLFVAGVFASLLRGHTLRLLGASFLVVLAATASAHLGAHAGSGAAGFAAGLLLTSVGSITATTTAIKLLTRRATAASRR